LEGYFIGATPLPSFLATAACTSPCDVVTILALRARKNLTDNFLMKGNFKGDKYNQAYDIYSRLRALNEKYCTSKGRRK